MSPPANTLEERLQVWLSGWLSKQRLPTNFQVLPLAGDGSPRPFYRIKISDKSFVLLSEPEWILSKDYPAHQAYLHKNGLPVPEFLAVDPKIGALLMEDMGDELLQTRLLARPDQRGLWLEKAVGLVAKMHGSTYPVDPAIPAATRSFDAKKYQEELAFTLEHLHTKLLKGGAIDPKLHKQIASFCEELGKLSPKVFCLLS